MLLDRNLPRQPDRRKSDYRLQASWPLKEFVMQSVHSVQPTPAAKPASTARKLVVGREIVVSGDIASCESLVVEGTVQANVECQDLRVEEVGLFNGSASVANAEIFGRFEGELTVTGRLHLRATGKISAKVRYHEIEIERGGQISGDLQMQTTKSPDAVSVTALRA
jgi:cytoskeletal protein CcmA (bactofilin family)